MKPTTFPGHNIVFAKDQPEYQPLPALRLPDGSVTSCWALSWRERLKLLFTGRLWFTQLTFGALLQPQLPQTDRPSHVAEASRSGSGPVAG